LFDVEYNAHYTDGETCNCAVIFSSGKRQVTNVSSIPNGLYVSVWLENNIFWDTVSLCGPGWPRIHDPPDLASQLLGL
jgi:hypothetical protein